MIFAVSSPVAQHSNRTYVLGIAGGYGAALTIGPQVLAGIKTKARHVSDAADRTAFVLCAMCLSRIFDDDEAMLPRHFHDRVHVSRLAIEMDGQDCLVTGSNRAFDRSGVHRK